MMNLIALLAGLLLSSCSGKGCGSGCPSPPPRAGLPPDQILAWSVSQGLWGSASLTLDRSGKLSYHFQPADPRATAESDETRLAPDEVRAIVTALGDSEVCGMCRLRSGIPDEAAPVLQVHDGDLDCRVEAWDGEWRERASAVAELMNDLTARARRPGP